MKQTTIKKLKLLIREMIMENPTLDLTQSEKGLNIITIETLQQIAPTAFTAMQTQIVDQEEDPNPIWVMTEKPELNATDNDQEIWTQTNEPELAERIAEGWNEYAVTTPGGKQIVILCGSADDEYGWLWNQVSGEWENYAY
jgi:hypothetical protein